MFVVAFFFGAFSMRPLDVRLPVRFQCRRHAMAENQRNSVRRSGDEGQTLESVPQKSRSKGFISNATFRAKVQLSHVGENTAQKIRFMHT